MISFRSIAKNFQKLIKASICTDQTMRCFEHPSPINDVKKPELIRMLVTLSIMVLRPHRGGESADDILL